MLFGGKRLLRNRKITGLSGCPNWVCSLPRRGLVPVIVGTELTCFSMPVCPRLSYGNHLPLIVVAGKPLQRQRAEAPYDAPLDKLNRHNAEGFAPREGVYKMHVDG